MARECEFLKMRYWILNNVKLVTKF